MSEFPLVLVRWKDAWADSHDQVTPEDVKLNHKVSNMISVGWLLLDDEDGVSIFCERYEGDGATSFRGRTFIPRAMITKIDHVTPTKRPRKKKVSNEVNSNPPVHAVPPDPNT